MTNPVYRKWSSSAPSGSSFNVKRKRNADPMSEDEDEPKQMRIRSPRSSNHHMSLSYTPEYMTDNSNSASDTDHDMGMDMDPPSSPHEVVVQHESDGYQFAESGTGGFGFGPGADEDEELMESSSPKKHQTLPNLTSHQNSHHFSHIPSQPTPWAAQPYSNNLRAPQARGLIQPTVSSPLKDNATDVERARPQHGPGCQSIPKLVLSQYPDPNTGEKTMWSLCESCGACELAQ
ncbi:hypothetical protein M231_02593 [Tremella mesenterica]|uniref:Uncharacterized protein n=1 Tax=Tremella mesenterica TaxID=5217 RepID=A0A4Q1BQD3_TREME|nr:uncharacterized protein TREMEDRAFT_71372 [Tremella mesenterica DSM 1558]EIW70753.1 hypothetical protein TREMEDRAFT_71372 [Tremella mesenterica DSM 1558]RXK40136.1 hypothetical protein M231_02593 [Tremella mesenterica]